MCRPLWSCWVNGRAYSVPGEGSHEDIAKHRYATIPPRPLRFPSDGELMEIVVESVDAIMMHPFECRWPTERKARFQPQGDRFYALEDVPTKHQFDMAQEQLDRDIGTPDKMRDWVLAAANLYGRGGLVFALDSYQHGTQPLIRAAQSVLVSRAANYVPWNQAALDDSRTRDIFERWAELFSERKNRIELWQT